MSTQRGRKRGPYKPRAPKPMETTSAVLASEPAPVVEPPVIKGWTPGEEGTTDEPQVFTHLLEWSPPAIRFVRFRYGWADEDTCPAVIWDDQLAVLLPPEATPVAGCGFSYRTTVPGTFSFVPARKGAGVGQYMEV